MGIELYLGDQKKKQCVLFTMMIALSKRLYKDWMSYCYLNDYFTLTRLGLIVRIRRLIN
ncbi:MAG TPA: hypothetical protein ACFYD7_06735 [Candidatus Wujingus californicus]|uniref:hypothetical protein n=1 Tax=Candidatus Wujingus californicus TaxID=3367618 RepID=UPI001DBCE8E5|nr:hypothetical protein [Planctomycetota bacterium]MDO8130996.1 hypothetical protein [Candidatus Brocadiales bacterium]